jgi:hypothetical protein
VAGRIISGDVVIDSDVVALDHDLVFSASFALECGHHCVKSHVHVVHNFGCCGHGLIPFFS